MVDKRQSSEAQLGQILAALADPTRRHIIELLREAGELRVSDVAGAFDMSLNGVSKHLKLLERAGLICRHIEGRTHLLRVDWEAMRRGFEFFGQYQRFWGQRLDALADMMASEEEEGQ